MSSIGRRVFSEGVAGTEASTKLWCAEVQPNPQSSTLQYWTQNKRTTLKTKPVLILSIWKFVQRVSQMTMLAVIFLITRCLKKMSIVLLSYFCSRSWIWPFRMCFEIWISCCIHKMAIHFKLLTLELVKFEISSKFSHLKLLYCQETAGCNFVTGIQLEN